MKIIFLWTILGGVSAWGQEIIFIPQPPVVSTQVTESTGLQPSPPVPFSFDPTLAPMLAPVPFTQQGAPFQAPLPPVLPQPGAAFGIFPLTLPALQQSAPGTTLPSPQPATTPPSPQLLNSP